MAFSVNEARLRLTAEDNTGRGMASAARNIRQTAREAEEAAKRLGAVQQRIASGVGQAAGAAGLGLSIAGTARVMKDSYTEFANFDRRMTSIGITADASADDMRKVGAELKRMADLYALPLDTMAEGLDALVSSGKTLKESMDFLPTIAATAQASGASIKDIATSADALSNHLGITGQQMQHAMDLLAAGGKAGKFELRDMAQYLPQLAPLAAAIGYKGEEGLKKLVAILQVVRKGTGDAGSAASSTMDMFSKMGSDDVQNKFRDFGGDLTGRLLQWRQEGGDTFGKFVKYTRDLLTERAKLQGITDPLELLPQLFGDREMQTGMRALLSQPGAVRDLAMALRSVDGTVFADLSRKQKDAAAATQRLSTAFTNLEQSFGRMIDKMGATTGLQWLAETFDKAAKGAENIAELGFGNSMGRAFNLRAYNSQVEDYRAKQGELERAKSDAEKTRLRAELKEMEASLEIARRRVYETGTAEDRKSLAGDNLILPPDLPGPLSPDLRDADPRKVELDRRASEAAAARDAVGTRRPDQSRGDFLERERNAELEKLRSAGERDQYDYLSRGKPGINGIEVENPRGAQEQTLKSIDRSLNETTGLWRQILNPINLQGGGFGGGGRFQRASYGDGGGTGSDPVGSGFGGSNVGIGGAGGGGGGGVAGARNMRYGGRGGYTPGGSVSGGGHSAPTNAQGKENVASWLAFAQKPVADGGLGLTAEQAHGMVAGLQGESGANLNPGAYNPNDRGMPSGGTAQWRGDRLRNLKEFARQQGKEWTDRGVQQQFLRHELLGSGGLGGGREAAAYRRIKAAGTRQEALYAHVAGFERPQFPEAEAQKRAAFLYGHGGEEGAQAGGVDTGDLRVKGGPRGQAFAGGETMPGTVAAARDAQRYGLPGGVSHFSAFNDRYHAGTGSKHAQGLAFDTTLKEDTREAYAAAAEAMRSRLRKAGLDDKDFTVLDEKNNPSRRATGPHLHTQFNSREAAAQYNQYSARQEAARVAAEAGKAAGEAAGTSARKAMTAPAPAPEAKRLKDLNLAPQPASVDHEPTAYERWKAAKDAKKPKLEDLDVSPAEKATKAKADLRAALGDGPIHVDVQPRIANAERLRDRTKAQSRREVDREVRDARLNTYSDCGVG